MKERSEEGGEGETKEIEGVDGGRSTGERNREGVKTKAEENPSAERNDLCVSR